MTLRNAAVALVGLVASSLLAATALDHLDVSRQRGRYFMAADAWLDATPESIYAVLTDYADNRFGRISSAAESRYLEPDTDGTPMVFTRMEGCVLWHCMSLRSTERLETEAPYRVKSIAIPESSSFKYNTSEWLLEPVGDGTRLIYKLEMEPDFSVPPIVGPWYLKRMLSQHAARIVMRIERFARELDGRPVEPSSE